MSDNDEQPSKVRKTCQGEEKPATASEEATSPAVKDVTATAVEATAEHEGNNKKTEDDEEEELFSFFEKNDDEQVEEIDTSAAAAPVASSTFIEDNKDEDSATLLNSLESFLVGEQDKTEEVKEEVEKGETKKPNHVEGSKQDAAVAADAAKEVTEETNVQDAAGGNDSKSRNLVVIDGLEIDIDELLKKDPEEDQYYIDEMEIEDFDFDQDFLEGTQMYTFVDDDDDGLVDITDLNLPEPVPAAAVAAAARRDGGSKDTVASASATTADAADKDDEDEPALGQAPQKKDEKKDLMKINPRMLKQKYYEQAKELWLEKIPEHQRSKFPLPRMQDLDNPRMWKHPTIPNAFYGGEGLHEWADRCHPLWKEYRDVDTTKHSYAQFVHHKWGYERGIDVTRNLTRFSSGDLDEHDPAAAAARVLACQYCVSVCFCSTGRKHKKPYLNPKAERTLDDTVPPDRRTRMLVSKEDFQHRIKTLIEMQLNRKNSDSAAASTAPSSAFWNAEQLPNAIKKAVNTIASSEEAFELALHYRSQQHETPTFSDDQAKELLSLEETLESFNIHYKSPYDDEDDDEEDETNVKWGSKVLQDY